MLNFAGKCIASQCTEPTRYAYILLYQVRKFCFLVKSTKNFKIMLTQTFEQENKTITVHTSEPNDTTFPFGVLETTTSNNDKETTKFVPILGNQVVSDKTFESSAECKKYIRSKPYELILALIANTIEMRDKWIKEQQELLNSKQNETK